MSDVILSAFLYKRRIFSAKMPKDFKIIKGSPVKLERKCGKKNCKCQRGKKHASLYLSQSKNGKTIMTYIPKQKEELVKKYVTQYKQMLGIINELSDINMQILKLQK